MADYPRVGQEGSEAAAGSAGREPRPAEGASPPTPAAGAAGGNLESLVNTVTQGHPLDGEGRGELLQVVGCRCGARTCKKCGPSLGWEARQVLEGKADLFPVPQLVSFTMSHEHFETPQAAFDHVTQGRYIARAMKALHVTRWVWVLEFHKGRAENGYLHRGWPHWHVVMDVSERSIRPADLRRLHRLCKEWKLGGFKLSRKKAVSEAIHALRYITKYLTKPGYIPGWFQQGTGRRMIQGSRAIGALRFRSGGRRDDQAVTRRRHARPLVERVAECRLRVTVLRRMLVEHVTDDGEVVARVDRTEWVGTLAVPWADLVNAALSGDVPLHVVARSATTDEDGERIVVDGFVSFGTGQRVLSIAMGTVDQAVVEAIKAWAAANGVFERVEVKRRERMQRLLAA